MSRFTTPPNSKARKQFSSSFASTKYSLGRDRDTSVESRPNSLRVAQSVFDAIREQIGNRRAEQGGMLGGSRQDGIIRHFYFDEHAQRSAVTYSPDYHNLNRLLNDQWNPQNIHLLGFVHSHPGNYASPSSGDEQYAITIMQANPQLECFWMPIITTIPDTGEFRISPFGVLRIGQRFELFRTELELIPDSQTSLLIASMPQTGSASVDERVEMAAISSSTDMIEPYIPEAIPVAANNSSEWTEMKEEAMKQMTTPSEPELAIDAISNQPAFSPEPSGMTSSVQPSATLNSTPAPNGTTSETPSKSMLTLREPSDSSPALTIAPRPNWLDPHLPFRLVAGSPPPLQSQQQPILEMYELANRTRWMATKEMFTRVEHAYDLPRLAHCRIIYIGVGGAAQFAEEMVRAGVGEHVFVDDDVVSESNLATQQCYRNDLGRKKVDVLKERLSSINPNARLVACPRRLDDLMTDEQFFQLVRVPLAQQVVYNHHSMTPIDVEPLRPLVTLICGLTDQFEAQARVNRLALQSGLPSLCAQVYEGGRGGEVSFTHPDTTPACHRCVLGGRYRAYLDQGYRNLVTSDGTPIFSTTRLNALKGYMALALLHHGSAHPRWGSLLQRIGNRNLIQIRMDPDLALPVFSKVLSGADTERIFSDDVVWLPQEPECPRTGFATCPECRATGNLRDAVGTFADTRPMPPTRARQHSSLISPGNAR